MTLRRIGCLVLGFGFMVGMAQAETPHSKKGGALLAPPANTAPAAPPPPAHVHPRVKPALHPAPIPVPAAAAPMLRPLPARPVLNPLNPVVATNGAGYNVPINANPWSTNVGSWANPYGTIVGPGVANPYFTPVSAVLPPMSSWRSPLMFSSGLNNPYWGNSGNPFATLSSPLTFAPGLNSPYWSGGIQQAQGQAFNIVYQQMLMQQWFQSMSYFQNPYFNMPNYGMTSPVFPMGAGGFGGMGGGRFLDAGPLGAPGVPQPLDGMAAIGAGFPAGLGR